MHRTAVSFCCIFALVSAGGPPVFGQERGSATQDKAHGAAQASAVEKDYVLGPADVIEVDVLGQPDFKTRARIGEDGSIQLPFIGRVVAANKTMDVFSREISKALEAGGYFVRPIVTIDIVSYASRYVTVLGQVTSPGLVPVDRPYRLSEIIARVGGLKDGAADYVVLRPQNGQERRLPLKALATGDLGEDPLVQPGDKIYSPSAEMFFISGQVKLPGSYPMTPDITIRMALSRGGGLTDLGSDHRITITRGGAKLKSVDLDSKVQPGDVIVVGERLF